MRIGINGRFYGARTTGVQRVARELSARLCADADITVFLPRGVTADLPATARIVSGSLSGHAWEQLELPASCRREGCDILLQLSGPGVLRAGASAILLHDVLPLTNPEWFAPAFALWYRFMLKSAAAKAALILTPSEWSKREIARALRVPHDRIKVVTQGMAPYDEPASAEAAARVRARYGLSEKYVLATGSGDPRKNVAFLYDVMARLQDSGSDAPELIVVGEASERVHRRPKPGQSNGIRHLGRVSDEDLRALYSGATVFCYPSLGEGFGRPPLEAMCCGTPAVVADYGSAREILGDTAAILPLDPARWADTLAHLLRDGDARARIVERGRAHAKRYQWSAAARSVLDACAGLQTAARIPEPAIT